MKPLHELPDDELGDRLRQSLSLPDAPAPWIAAAVAQWRVAPTRPAVSDGGLGGVWRRLVATLSVDTWAMAPAALGLRGESGEIRHLLFTAEGRDIDLRIATRGQAYALTGQVLGPDDRGEVEILDAAAAGDPRRVALDDLGEFRCDDLAPGTYRLTLRLGEDEVSLPPIEVGPR